MKFGELKIVYDGKRHGKLLEYRRLQNEFLNAKTRF